VAAVATFAAGVFDGAFFPMSFVFADLAFLHNGDGLADVADAGAFFGMGYHHGAGDVFFDPDGLADDLFAFTFFAVGDHDSVLVVDFLDDGLADLSSAALFDPFGNADIDGAFFNDPLGDADRLFHNFPGAGGLAGNFAVLNCAGAAVGVAATGFFAEAPTCLSWRHESEGDSQRENETHTGKLLPIAVRKTKFQMTDTRQITCLLHSGKLTKR
jgi:hypothetical protein